MGWRRWLVEWLGGEWPDEEYGFDYLIPDYQKRGNILVREVKKGTEEVLWEDEVKPFKYGDTVDIHGQKWTVTKYLCAGDILQFHR